MERRILTVDELSTAIAALDGWAAEGSTIKKSSKFSSFADALAFVNKVGVLAEAADHHPDITFGWGYADIMLTTHDRGGVTDVDTALAARIDQIS
jgi:4a-hydroxytetrahydrobiopterin dehydratase